MGHHSAEVDARGAANHARKSIVAETVAVAEGRASKMPHDRIVGRYQAEGSERNRHQPVPIHSAQAQRALPNRFLVQRQIPRQMNYAEAGNLVRSRCSKSS